MATVTEAPKAVVIGVSSQRIADCLAAIDTTLQSRKRQREALAEDATNANEDTIEFREQTLREHLQTLSEFIVSFGAQLTPIAERIARTLISAIITRQVPLNESWEACALFCAYFPTAGAAILTEIFEQFLQHNTVWMPTLMGLQYLTITPRLDSIADMITASIPFVEASLAQRFASLFTSEATDIAIWRRSQMMGGQTVIVLPHAVNNVFCALLMSLRPCPPSVVSECVDRVVGMRGHSHSLHATFPKPQVAANKAPNFITGGNVSAGTATNSDSLQISPLPLPFLGAYKLAQESSVRLRSLLSQVMHPRSQPFYQPPTTTVVDVWPVPSAASAQAAANANGAASTTEAPAFNIPNFASAPEAPSSSSAAAGAEASAAAATASSGATLHPALGGSATPSASPKAPVPSAKKAASPKQQPVAPKTNAAAPKIEDLPDIEF